MYVCVLVIIVQMQFYGFSESSEEKGQEENWQFGLFVSHKQPRHSFLHIFLKRTYYKAFFSSIGMRLFAKIKNNKYCCESTTYYLKLQMHFCPGAIFWVHSSLGTILTFGANLKVSGGKWYIWNYSGKKHKNCKGGKFSQFGGGDGCKAEFQGNISLPLWSLAWLRMCTEHLECSKPRENSWLKILLCTYCSVLCCLSCNYLKWWFSFQEAIENLCAATDNVSGLSLEKCSHHIKPEAQCPSGEMGQMQRQAGGEK